MYTIRMQMLRTYLRGIFLLALVGAVFFVWWVLFDLQSGKDLLTVVFLDVGQGDAIFLQSPQGRQMLIDGGPNKKVLSELGEVMPFYDHSIDMVLLTHPHEDHAGGLIDVLKRYNVGMIVESDKSVDTGTYREWGKAKREENAVYIQAKRGQRIWLDSNVYFDILYPFEDTTPSNDPHSKMIVGKLTYGAMCFIFAGDAERNIEYQLLNDDIDCDVFKIGHHGSKTSTSDAFLNAVSPAIAVISAGRENRYGHPHHVIFDKLQSAGITIFRTDEEGRVTLFSDGERVWEK